MTRQDDLETEKACEDWGQASSYPHNPSQATGAPKSSRKADGSRWDNKAVESDVLLERVAAPPARCLDDRHRDTLSRHVGDFTDSYGMGVEARGVQTFQFG